MASKPTIMFKPSVAAICVLSGVGLNVRVSPSGKETTRKTFSEAEFKRSIMDARDRKRAPQTLAWLKKQRIIAGPDKGPYALTDKGQRVASRACTVWARRGR